MNTTNAYRWPTTCPVCASHRLLVWMHTGQWACLTCDVDSTDTPEWNNTKDPRVPFALETDSAVDPGVDRSSLRAVFGPDFSPGCCVSFRPRRFSARLRRFSDGS